MSRIGPTVEKMGRRSMLAAVTTTVALFSAARYSSTHAQAQGEPLPSWKDGPAKQSILDFVRATTNPSSKDFVAPEDRIATFDQDGTLWVEHPLYTQTVFALDRLHTLAPQHPEWQNQEPFKSILSNDQAAIAHLTEGNWAEIIFLTHSGMSQAAFGEIAGKWLETAKHPRFQRLYTELVYQPMLEVLRYLRANGFATYIVSGGGQDFIRVYSQRVYGIPPEQVVGSSIATKYEFENGRPELL